jgi:hypothetical protein
MWIEEVEMNTWIRFRSAPLSASAAASGMGAGQRGDHGTADFGSNPGDGFEVPRR